LTKIVKLNPAKAAMVQTSAGYRLQDAHRRFDQPVNLVGPVSFVDSLPPTTRAFGVPTKLKEEIAFRADALFTASAFKNGGIHGPFPEATARPD
jgi:hypothetical protein